MATEAITATVSFVDYLILPAEGSQNLLVRNGLEMHDITRYIVTAVYRDFIRHFILFYFF